MGLLWNFTANGLALQVRAATREQAIAYIRATLPKSDVDYESLTLEPMEAAA